MYAVIALTSHRRVVVLNKFTTYSDAQVKVADYQDTQDQAERAAGAHLPTITGRLEDGKRPAGYLPEYAMEFLAVPVEEIEAYLHGGWEVVGEEWRNDTGTLRHCGIALAIAACAGIATGSPAVGLLALGIAGVIVFSKEILGWRRIEPRQGQWPD